MVKVSRLVLDVLKPHQPNALDFALALVEQCPGYRVHVTVQEVDEKTESTLVDINAEAIDFANLSARIEQLGASIHSIDEVEVCNESHDESH